MYLVPFNAENVGIFDTATKLLGLGSRVRVSGGVFLRHVGVSWGWYCGAGDLDDGDAATDSSRTSSLRPGIGARFTRGALGCPCAREMLESHVVRPCCEQVRSRLLHQGLLKR